MPLTIACPSCPAKLKVPENAAGRRVKCPKCGGVMTVPADAAPSGAEPPPAPRVVPITPPPPPPPPPPFEAMETLDFTAPPSAEDLAPVSPPPARGARRVDPDPEPPRPARRAEAPPPARRREESAPPARRKADDDYRPDDYRNDDPDGIAPRLHRGWKSVALGYRMFGLGMLFALLGVLGTIGAAAAISFLGGKDTSMIFSNAGEKVRAEVLAVPTLVGGFFGGLAALFAFLGYLFLMFIPKDEDGGKGKTLGVVMFILLFVPGLNALVPWLLPAYSAGVGTALGKPKLTKWGWGLYIWYAVGLILLPLLDAGAVIGGSMIDPPGKEGLSPGMIIGGIAAAVITLILGFLVYLSVWGTFVGIRRGIQAAVRERGVIDGEGPRPVEKPRGKKGKRDEEAEDERPARGKGKPTRDRGEPADEPRPAPAKRVREEPEEERPRAKRRRDEDEDDGRPRKRR